MVSILSQMDEHDIAAAIQMERMVHKGTFLIVEGRQDLRRFSPFIDESGCSIVCAHSCRKAELALRLLEKRRFPGVLCVTDADFRRIIGLPLGGPNLVHSEYHDLDLDWATEAVLNRYLAEVGDESKVTGCGGTVKIVDDILNELYPLSCAKLLNARRVFAFKVNNIDVSKCLSTGGDVVDAFVDELVSNGNVSESLRSFIKVRIASEVKNNHDLLQVTNGHDLFCALGHWLQGRIGSRRYQQTWGSEIGLHIRLSLERVEFFALSVVKSMIAWEVRNPGYKIFH